MTTPDDDLADLRAAGRAAAEAAPRISPDTAARVLAVVRSQRRRRAAATQAAS